MKIASLKKLPVRQALGSVLIDPFIYGGVFFLVLSFAPFNFWYFTWFGIAFFIHSFYQSKSGLEAFFRGLWISLLYTVGGFYWIAHAIHHFGNLPFILSCLLLLLYGLVGQLQFTAYSIFVFYFLKKNKSPQWLHILYGTTVYCVMDYFLPKLFLDSFGSNAYTSPSLRQLASLGGVSFITFLFFSLNFSLYFIVLHFKNKKAHFKTLTPLLVFPLITLLFYGIGFFENKKQMALLENPEKKMKLAVIQGNIGDFDKLASRAGSRFAAQELLDIFFRLSNEALKKEPQLDYIIWPETTYPSSFRKPYSFFDRELDSRVEEFVKEKKVSLLFGGYDTKGKTDYNALYFLTPPPEHAANSHSEIPEDFTADMRSLNPLQVYQKSVLLPFGEYIPILDSIDFVKKLFPQMGFFGRGPGPTVYDIPTSDTKNSTRFMPLICYEALFETFTQKAPLQNAQWLLNVTNDSWFGPYAEPYQHLALSVFRSIETRLPQVRSTNTGISTLILPTGEMVRPSTLGSREALIYEVPLATQKPSIYVLYGWAFPYLLLCILVFNAVFRLKTRKK